VKVVCVVSGFLDSVAVEEGWGRVCMPSSCAAGVCVRNAKGAPVPFATLSPFVVFAGDVELRDSCLGATLGCSKALNRAICASLRFFSAMRAALSFCVSMSLRRRV
jgi:hypothetical protein